MWQIEKTLVIEHQFSLHLNHCRLLRNLPVSPDFGQDTDNILDRSPGQGVVVGKIKIK